MSIEKKYDDRLIFQVATHYIHGKKQEDIVQILQSSGYPDIRQSTVSKLISRAREKGIIRVSLYPPREKYLEDKLKNKLRNKGIKDIVVVSGNINKDISQNIGSLGMIAAETILEIIKRSDDTIKITMSCGTSVLSATTKFFDIVTQEDWESLLKREWQIYPSYLLDDDSFESIHPHPLVSHFAVMLMKHMELLNSKGKIKAFSASLPYGFYNFSKEKRKKILGNSTHIQERLQKAKESNIILLGIGSVKHMLTGKKKEHFMEMFKKVGDKNENIMNEYTTESNFILMREDGSVDEVTEEKLVGINISHLRKIKFQSEKNIIAIAGGEEKREAIKAALVDPYFNILITDQSVAEYLEEEYTK